MVKPTRLGYRQYLLGIPMNYQVTLNIAQDLLSHSLFVRLILWSAEIGRITILLTSKISIALAIHSLDPLE